LFDYGIDPVFDYQELIAQVGGNKPPAIISLTADPATVATGGTSTITVAASDPENDLLTCTWSASGGTLSATTGCGSVTWTASGTSGNYTVSVSVSDNKGNHDPVTGAVAIIVSPSAYTLTVNKSGTGSGTVTGTGINCGSDCTESYASGTSVTLTASSLPGATFTSWSGCDSSSGNICTVTINQNRTVTATFTMVLPPVTLNVVLLGTGSSMGTVTGTGINCGLGGSDCSESYASGTSVTLTATPAETLYRFVSWGSGCDSPSGNTCTVIMNEDKTVTAEFGYNW
jgi:hypothetical protein